MISTLSKHSARSGAHPALYEGVGIRRANQGMNDFDVLGLKNGVEGGGEFHIVIMDQKADARGCFISHDGRLCKLFASRLSMIWVIAR